MTDARSYHDRWQDVLSGDVQLDRHDEQAIASWRKLLQHNHGTDPEPLDRATHTRVMNALRARGAFTPLPSRKAARQPVLAAVRPLSSAQTWPRWAAPLPVVVALIAVPLAWFQPHLEADTDLQTQTLGKSAPAAQSIRATRPEAEAQRLRAMLGQQGATVTVMTDGADYLVLAEMPVGREPEWEAVLVQEGLAPASDGRVMVRFVPAQR